jgi:methanethiol S-methyltransferase
MLGRITTMAYGTICYVVFLITFLYAIGFVGNLWVPKSMDSGRTGPLMQAIAIDLALLALFAIQHSVMARQWFKRAWTSIIPPSAERSTYVLFSSLCLLLLFWRWQPIGGTIWEFDDRPPRAVMLALYASGWAIVLTATFMTNHFDLFGLRQAWIRFQGRAYEPIAFRTTGFYKLVRHPLYVGWLLVFWSTPVMTVTHLLFAAATTAYILIAIQFEERDLLAMYGETYARYRSEVPMLAPLRRRSRMLGLSRRVGAN